jgi:hypothetical protein
MQENENRWKFEKVDINLIDESEINANKMPDEYFSALCDNIENSGLSTTLCCYKRSNGKFVLISGHHRLRACKKLHYKQIGILYALEEELSRDEILAVQLSHNSLHGEDDKNILKKMFAQIQSIEFKKFAHVNVEEIQPIESNGLNIISMKENYTISIVLYNDSLEFINELIGDINELKTRSDLVLIADQKNEDKYLEIQRVISKNFDIKSTNISFSKMLELAAKQLHIEE